MKVDKRYIVTDPKKHGGKRKKPIRVFVPHHNAGVATGESLARYIKNTSRQLSATYIIGQNGEVFQGLDEGLEPYTTGNRAIDTEAITFEIANSTGAPQWKISDKAFDTLVNLTIDICKRHGIKELSFTGGKKGNIHLHKWYQDTSCPGPYLAGKMPEYARRVNEGLKPTKPTSKGEIDMWKVQVGAFKEKANAERLAKELNSKGYKTYIIWEDDKPQIKTPRTYTVRKNDSFWAIAHNELGDGSRDKELAEFNGLKINSVIHPGQKLKMPN